MTVNYAFLRKFGAVLILAALSALLYLRLPSPHHHEYLPSEFGKLSALVNTRSDAIFAPLDGNDSPMPPQELRTLRASFSEGRGVASANAQAMYSTAVELCDSLLRAIQERERVWISLADTRSKPFGVSLAQDKVREEREKRKFFEFAVLQRWADSSRNHRLTIGNLYSRLRIQEREFMTGPSPQSNVGNTVVLKRPTTVQLKYGSTMLPAGMSLVVVDRSPSGVVVDYAGEHITLPEQ